ncbi:hypothetical protein Pisl_1980 [Pyrobaculum islandicum DSM 4184]|uniref:Uncharacterized protein n=1 Tax=Pyrobaculum islandicum (strain DSM 4184 / JCM 9189 / GEO3) TaxID=384616 RepID=A1RVZ5_PYRIL|nr:hypothetical protein [Pyrobaculum islandicum]ABL89127.1 hypothetical protein Pisl_1980 [Pyrobaculum islandicum DSM 4184]
MLPFHIKETGVRNLLRYFPPLAYLVLVEFEGGDAAEEAEAMGLPRELGSYVRQAVERLERELLAEVLSQLGQDQQFLNGLHQWISQAVIGREELWGPALLYIKHLYWETEEGPYSRCMEAEELEAYLAMAQGRPEQLRAAGLVYRKYDPTLSRHFYCSPRWYSTVFQRISAAVKEELGGEAYAYVKSFVERLFWNPRGYAYFRSAVFKDTPVVPYDEFIGDVALLPGVFDGRRLNPTYREAAKKAIFQVERIDAAELDEEFGVYVDGGEVVAPTVEAVGHKMLAKYRGKRVVALAKFDIEIPRLKPKLEIYGVEIKPRRLYLRTTTAQPPSEPP